MSNIQFTLDEVFTVCMYIDENLRVFIYSVNTSEYKTEDEAKKAALNMALLASKTYQE